MSNGNRGSLADKIEEIVSQTLKEIDRASALAELQSIEISCLGRKGHLTGILRTLGSLDPQERPWIGKLANQGKERIKERLRLRQVELEHKELRKELAKETIDITLPGRPVRRGVKNIITSVVEEITEIFVGLGYRVAEGPDVELDYYNFEALNMPPDHPARSLWDTLYVTDKVLLRTHTSPVQIRYMEEHEPPIYIIAPGKVYRRDYDISHAPMFHQIEGLAVDKNISMADLKGTLEAFTRAVFGPEARIRFRPSYFPFTEPSAEVDVSCVICGGKGCRVCSDSGWLEILGAGMVDPSLYKHVGYDPEEVSAFAFGMGVDRIAMLKYGISDIRLFFENDLRFLEQFR
ncbi:phenylalanyl-tRNA synthetase alpha chain [Candidatus Hakubella thermalkaliphila]|uniref:Phenylalanine--tRNA ligase alpha subunit n=1 Tax=Candidatus Hakubella thermalkaliphila TaxID=2754717 RepID=A0A6V8PR80_9ACTN|nr:phenylalanine--tRNA ligase subunit alpha [Candidatus Hakubella thermalkaliphila]GFP34284.1 phenylalanyl-tRNA synthetase alpha chain [Candidatus Hakubella thermalkaliphila]